MVSRLLALASIATLVASGCAAGTFVGAPVPAHGAAPGLKVQRLSEDGAHERRFMLVFSPGDDVMSGLTDFAEREHLGAAQITAIGGVSDATLGYFDRGRLLYREIPVDEQAEVTSLVGDVAVKDGKPVVHVHANLALHDGTTRGGHLLHAHVWPTLEVVVVDSPRALQKVHQAALGIDAIVPEETAGVASPASR